MTNLVQRSTHHPVEPVVITVDPSRRRKTIVRVKEAWHVATVHKDHDCTECWNPILAGSSALKANGYYQHINCETAENWVPAFDCYREELVKELQVHE